MSFFVISILLFYPNCLGPIFTLESNFFLATTTITDIIIDPPDALPTIAIILLLLLELYSYVLLAKKR